MLKQATSFWGAIPESLFMEPRAFSNSAWTGHVPFAFWVIEKLQPRQLVELGTWHGMSYLAFCQAIEAFDTGTKAFAVDTWQGDVQAGALSSNALDTLRKAHDPHYSGFSTLKRMTFDQASSDFADSSVDLLHIDGLHTYEAVRNDFETWLPKLSHRAVVLFHDTRVRERDFGVYKLWEELTERYANFEFHHEHGLGVLAVGYDLPPELVNFFEATQDPETAGRTRKLFDRLGRGVRSAQRAIEIQQGWDHMQADIGVRAVMKARRMTGTSR